MSLKATNNVGTNSYELEIEIPAKDFEDALQNNDTVMLGDLSEYEICPRLKEISKALQSM